MNILLSLLNYGFTVVNVDVLNKVYDVKDLKDNNREIVSCYAIVTGKVLCVFGHRKKKSDILYLYNIETKKSLTFHCKHIFKATSAVSVYPGKIYVISNITDSIVSLFFDQDTLSIQFESVHYCFSNKSEKSWNLSSLYSYQNRWFTSFCSNGGGIYELTNDRIVYSDIKNPSSLFFNIDGRLCFLEKDRNKFHAGNDIFYLDKNPTAVIEDIDRFGYWVSYKSFNGSYLSFYDYSFKYINTIHFNEIYDISNMLWVSSNLYFLSLNGL